VSVTIPVGKNARHGWALIDDDIAERYGSLRWHQKGKGYVACTLAGGLGQPSRSVYLHHLVTGPIPVGYEVDHIDGDRRNNQRSNLEVGTKSENGQNRRGAHPSSTTGLRGVIFDKRQRLQYRAKLKLNGKQVWLGSFATAEEAAAAAAAGRARLMPFSAEARAAGADLAGLAA
jgi:HNH endonuclease/AP2 domain